MGDGLDYELIYGIGDTIFKAISIIFGFLIVFILLYLMLVTTMDVVYLTFPVIQEKLRDYFDNKKLFGLKLLSDDAINSLEEAHTNPDQNVWVIYLKKRVITYLVSAFLLYLLYNGGADISKLVASNVIRILKALKLI